MQVMESTMSLPGPGLPSRALAPLRPRGLMLLLCLVFGLAGCASLSEKECRQGDWRGIGLEDGRAGRALGHLEEHREACTKYGIAPDETAYNAGRTEGLRSYCTVGNGFEVGTQGESYQGVCPPLLEGAFLRAFENGRELHDLRAAVADAESRISDHEQALRRVEDDLRYAERAVAEERDEDRRRDLARDLRRLAEERGRLRGELYSLQDERRARTDRLQDFREHLREDPDYVRYPTEALF